MSTGKLDGCRYSPKKSVVNDVGSAIVKLLSPK